ncbi:MAG: hypothetical protein EOO00_14615, partial [Chitinophagaceae bacterium]
MTENFLHFSIKVMVSISTAIKCNLGSYKEMIDKALELGSQQQCPHCQLKGLKDDGCTHIVCMRCEEDWCYCCGKKQSEVDLPQHRYLGHQSGWQDNNKRCPLYLEDLAIEDDDWPKEGEEAVAMYHQQ